MAQFNTLNLPAVHQSAQAAKRNRFALERAELNAEREDQMFDEEQKLKNTYRLYGGLKVVDELFTAGKNDEAFAAADEISRSLMDAGIIDPEQWDPSLVTPESTKEGLAKLEAVIGGRPRPGVAGTKEPSVPAKLQQAEWWLAATPEERQGYMSANYAGSVRDIAGVPHWVMPGGDAIPLSTKKDEIGFEEEKAGAVAGAQAEARTEEKRVELERQNESTFNVYETGMRGLVEAMGGTATGPVFGLVPAVTANQQMAEGAIAAMAPVLKQMFRAAGEGIFTDRDQQLLLDMVPKRTDLAEARAWKVQMIDSIVRAKLGMEPVVPPSQDEVRLQNARDAIARGADPNAVRERLRGMGIDPGRL